MSQIFGLVDLSVEIATSDLKMNRVLERTAYWFDILQPIAFRIRKITSDGDHVTDSLFWHLYHFKCYRKEMSTETEK